MIYPTTGPTIGPSVRGRLFINTQCVWMLQFKPAEHSSQHNKQQTYTYARFCCVCDARERASNMSSAHRPLGESIKIAARRADE